MYFTVLIPGVQNSIGQLITSRLSEDFGVEVSLEEINIQPIKSIVVKGFIIKDTNHDTLLYVKSLKADIDSLVFSRNQLYFGRITAENAISKLYKIDNKFNFKTVLDSIQTRQSGSSKWKYNTTEFKLINSRLLYKTNNKQQANHIFDPGNIQISNLNFTINRIKTFTDSFSTQIKNLSFIEKSGFAIKNTKGIIAAGNSSFTIKQLKTKTKHSYVSIQQLELKLDSTTKANRNFAQMPFFIDINSVSASHQDIAYFLPAFPKIKYPINMKGILKGTLGNIKGRNIHINAGIDTRLNTHFDIQGLPNLSETFLFLNVKELSTNIPDLTKIMPLYKNADDFSLPKSFDQLGEIKYSGKFSGFIDNLVAYGQFTTDIGKIKTDLGIKITEDNKLVYSGFLNTTSLNIGKLLNSEENLNKITMDVSVQGYRTKDKHFNAYINGTIDSIDYNHYNYEKIVLNGLLSNKRFNGKISLNDPNAQVSFNGKMDFENEVPEFDFNASVKNLNLANLQIAPSIENTSINAEVHSYLYGKNLNEIEGDIELLNGSIVTDKNTFELDSFIITSVKEAENFRQLKVASNLIEAELSGDYQLKQLPKQANNLLHSYLPSLFNIKDLTNETPCDINFYIKSKNIEELLFNLNPKIKISDNSTISGEYNHANSHMEIYADFSELKYKSLQGENINLHLKSDNQKVSNELRFEKFSISDFLPFYNFTLSQKASNDTLVNNVFWNNWEEKTNSGAIFTSSTFNKSYNGELYANIQLLPSAIIINDTTWTIQESSFNFNPNGMRINTFRTHHLNQEISINGSVYNQGNHKLSAYFRNIDLSESTQFFNIKRLSFGGILNGGIEIKENIHSPIVTSDIIINDFVVNNESIGNLSINSQWDKEKKAVVLDTKAKRNAITPMVGKGFFSPKNKNFEFAFDFDSIPIGFLDLYLSKVAQNFRGTASGHVNLNNNNKDIDINGDMHVNNAMFDVNLLKCSFYIKDSIRLTEDSIVFKNMTITDPQGKTGSFKGEILHTLFRGMSYDLYARADNMLLLNTKVQDNPYYYGTVYGSGDLSVKGLTNDLNIDIQGKTEGKTKFYIPITDKEESLDNNFIQFISHADTTSLYTDLEKTNEYQVDLSNFSMNMGLQVTEDAEIQVIFDPSVGDILKTIGHGNIQVQISKEGNINFYGDYTAEDGDYLFSLENVVNKRFNINKGGTVIWEGDPYDALIDIMATYKIKTSIQPLVAPSTDEISENSEIYKRIPINCDLILGDRLSQPSVHFDISAPTMEESTQNIIEDAISTEEELNRQVLSLLILNKFFTPSYNSGTGNSNQVNRAALTTTSEMLSSYLSNWLSQISSDLDVGINYRPEDEISSEQIEVALSTQIFNNRVSLNGNVEYGGYSATQQNTSNIVGDFDMDVKLNKSGSLRAKAYTHSNDDFTYNDSPTTQGVGLSYQEEFNTFGELIRKYWNWLTGKAKKEKEVKPEDD